MNQQKLKESTQTHTNLKVNYDELVAKALAGKATEEEKNTGKTLKRDLDKAKKNMNSDAKASAASNLLLEKAKTELAKRKAVAEKKVSKKPYYTTSNIQSSINRRTVRLNATKGNIDKTWSNAGKKISRTAEKAFKKGILGYSMQQGYDYAKYGNGKQRTKLIAERAAKEAAYKQNKRQKEAKAGPSFFSSLKSKLTPNYFKGAKALQSEVAHINFLGNLKTEISELAEKMKPNENRNFDDELRTLQSNKITMTPEDFTTAYNALEKSRQDYNKLKYKKIELENQSKARANKLQEITEELESRTNPEKIGKTVNIFNRISEKAKTDKFPNLYEKDKNGNQVLKSLDNINMDELKILLTKYTSANKTSTYLLLEQLYKHKKNTNAIKIFKEELGQIKPTLPIPPIQPVPTTFTNV